MTLKKFELHLDVAKPNSDVIGLLSAACSLSIRELKQAINKGALWHSKHKKTQRLRRLKKPLQIGEQLHFYYDERVIQQLPPTATLVADEQGYSLWHKPYGMLSQGSKWSDHCTITRWVEKALDKPCFIVHRLDRAASGLIIVAHSKTITQQLGKLFEQHNLDKQYQIIVHGQFTPSDAPVIETSPVDNKKAKSTFTFIEYDSSLNMSLVNVKIHSGRKHQIRIHSAALGFPVVGDRLHGDNEKHYPEQLNLQLCAVKLAFNCPIENKLKRFELPCELRPQLTKLRAFKDCTSS